MGETNRIQTWHILRSFGFQLDPKVMSDFEPGLSFDFGGFRLSVGFVLNARYARIPKRIMHPSVEVLASDTYLQIGKYRYDGVTTVPLEPDETSNGETDS